MVKKRKIKVRKTAGWFAIIFAIISVIWGFINSQFFSLPGISNGLAYITSVWMIIFAFLSAIIGFILGMLIAIIYNIISNNAAFNMSNRNSPLGILFRFLSGGD